MEEKWQNKTSEKLNEKKGKNYYSKPKSDNNTHVERGGWARAQACT